MTRAWAVLSLLLHMLHGGFENIHLLGSVLHLFMLRVDDFSFFFLTRKQPGDLTL